MPTSRQATNIYRPTQPILQKALIQYNMCRTKTSSLFNGGIEFSAHSIDSSYLNHALVLPDGCVHLVICCHPDHPSANICGSLFKGREGVFVRSQCEYFSICFLPGYAEYFFKNPIGAFSELEIPVQDVLPHADVLLERVVAASGLEGRIAAFESYYLEFFHDTLEIHPLIKHLTETIVQSNGTLNITELSQDTGYSTRYLVKTFEKYIGLSPKLFSRVIRFQHVIQYLDKKDYRQLLDHIYELGYCDQNHFIKDFKEFSCLTPKNYVQTANTGLLNLRVGSLKT